MKVPCFDASGKRSGDTDLPVEIFDMEFDLGLIHRVIVAERSNRQQGTHHTKTRSEVSGGGRKPWKQKGTGNARHGSTRSPLWKGGGTTFGPRVHRHRMDLPKKMRKAGIRSIFSARAKEGVISVLRDFQLKEYSTKMAYNTFKKMGVVPNSTVVYVSDSDDAFVQKSFSNIRNIKLLHAKRVTAPEVMYAGRVVIAETALARLVESYARQSVRKKSEAVS